MWKPLPTIIAVLAIFASYATTFYYGGEYRENKLIARDHSDLVKSTQEIVNRFHKLDTQVAELDKIAENPPAGPNSSAAVDILRQNRQASAHPIPAPAKPAIP